MSFRSLGFWKNATHRRKRIYSVVLVFIVAVLIMAIGSYVPLSEQDATEISQNLNSTLQTHQGNNTLTQFIFQNNFSICLLMFIPFAGAAFGLLVLFSTGVALGAIASTQGFPVWLAFGSLAVTPVFWLEFAAYSIAMAESVWLLRRIVQVIQLHSKNQGALAKAVIKRELKWLGVFLAICAGLLIVGAVVEVLLINFANSIIPG